MQCYDFALDYYRKAVDILTNIMKEEYISKIEYLDARFCLKQKSRRKDLFFLINLANFKFQLFKISVLQTPRSKKFVSHSDTPPKIKLTRDGNCL